MRPDVAGGADVLRGRTLMRVPGGGSQELWSAAEWYEAVAEMFGIRVPEEDRVRLCGVTRSHEPWLAGQ
jgi:hypothetical protein